MTKDLVRYSRTSEEELKDFKYISKLRSKGYTWLEVAEILNEERPYHLIQRTYQLSYQKHLHSPVHANEVVVRLEKDRMIEELDFVILESFKSWRESCMEGVKELRISGSVVKGKYNELDDEILALFEELEHTDIDPEVLSRQLKGMKNTGKYTKYTITKKTNIGNPAFLTTAMKAMEKKADLLGLNTPKKVEFDIRAFMLQHNVSINDALPANTIPIPLTSEKEVLEYYSEDDDIEL